MSRLLSSRRPLARFALSLVPLTAIAAELARMGTDSSTEAADRGLGLLLLSLLPLSLAWAVLDFDPYPEDASIALGQNRRRLVLGWCTRLALGTTLLTLLLTAAVLLWTRTVRDPKLLTDLAVSLPIALGACLATLGFLLAARAWGGKLGLGLSLLLSWTLGQSDVVASGLLPGGQVRHLLGLGEPLPLTASLAAACLAGWTLLSLTALSARVPR